MAVAAIVALGAACLAGSPLYLSSVGSAAVQNELRHTCLADVGLRIPMGGAQPDLIARLQTMAEPLAAHTQPSVVTRIAPDISVTTNDPDGKVIRVHLIYRDGQEQNLLRPVKPVGDGQVLAPEWMNPPAGTAPGDQLTLFANDNDGKVAWKRTFTVVDTYPLVPTRPESSYWCGLRAFFRSASNDPADPPTPVLLTTSDDIRQAEAFRVIEWEVRPDPDGMSRHDAAVLADRFNAIADVARHTVDVDESIRSRQSDRRRTVEGCGPPRGSVDRGRRRHHGTGAAGRIALVSRAPRFRDRVGDARATAGVAPAAVERRIAVVARLPGRPRYSWRSGHGNCCRRLAGVGCGSILRPGIGARNRCGAISHRVHVGRCGGRVRRHCDRGSGSSQDVRRQSACAIDRGHASSPGR